MRGFFFCDVSVPKGGGGRTKNGPRAHFLFVRVGRVQAGGRGLAMTLRDTLNTLLQPVVEGLGYELWELEYQPGRGNGLLRIRAFRRRRRGRGCAGSWRRC